MYQISKARKQLKDWVSKMPKSNVSDYIDELQLKIRAAINPAFRKVDAIVAYHSKKEVNNFNILYGNTVWIIEQTDLPGIVFANVNVIYNEDYDSTIYEIMWTRSTFVYGNSFSYRDAISVKDVTRVKIKEAVLDAYEEFLKAEEYNEPR